MAEWRVGRKLGKTIYRDEMVVGYIEDPAVAAEVVETMNRVDTLLAEVRPLDPNRRRAAESGRERSPATGGEPLPRLLHDPYDDNKGGVTGG